MTRNANSNFWILGQSSFLAPSNLIMGKSIRSKVMKRFRTCKRLVIGATTDLDRMKASNMKCQLIAAGHHFEVKPALNGFRYPNKTELEIPKVILNKNVDFRSEALPTAGYAVSRNRRKASNKGTIVVSTTTPTVQETMEM